MMTSCRLSSSLLIAALTSSVLLAESVPSTADHTTNQVRAPSESGFVSSLFTLGSPGSGSPGLRSVRSADGCFPGLRSFTKTNGFLTGWYYDPVPYAAQTAFFYHPLMDAAGLAKTAAKKDKDLLHQCSTDTVSFPPWNPAILIGAVDWSLHLSSSYNPAMEITDLPAMSPYKGAVGVNLLAISYTQEDADVAQKLASKMGYNVVGASKFKANFFDGLEVSYLLQHPTTLHCYVTFQGTYSHQDAATDLAAFAVPFCGMTQKGEQCCSDLIRTLNHGICPGPCVPPKNPKDTFVHEGFRNQLRRMIETKSFKDRVHARLPSCSQVDVFGHSLGGAMAELFTSCAERPKAEGDYGFKDYSLIGWQKGTPTKLPVDASFGSPEEWSVLPSKYNGLLKLNSTEVEEATLEVGLKSTTTQNLAAGSRGSD